MYMLVLWLKNVNNSKMLIYEKKDIEINELTRGVGDFIADPMSELFHILVSTTKEKVFNLYLLKYYTKKVGISPDEFTPKKASKIRDYLFNGKDNGIKKYITYDLMNGLAFYLSKKILNLKSGGFGLSYFLDKEKSTKIRNFYFFDTALEIFIGKVEVQKVDRVFAKGTLYQVSTSATERKLIGLGFGTKMYLSIMENCDYLISSTVLFSGSYKLWTTSLPKQSNVWWSKMKSHGFEKIDPSKQFEVDSNDIDFFIASIFHDEI